MRSAYGFAVDARKVALFGTPVKAHCVLTPESSLVTGVSSMSVEAVRRLCWGVARLPPLERAVIVRRFGLRSDRPETLAEVADHLQVSRQRVYQRQQAALARLADAMGGT